MMIMKKFNNIQTQVLGLMAVVLTILSACNKGEDFQLNDTITKSSVLFVGLTNTNAVCTAGQLIRYNANNVNQLVGAAQSINPANLQANEVIVAIDYRPATGMLYGISNQSRLYILNPLNGAARVINSTPFTPTVGTSIAGFDFNPTLDRIRVVLKTGQNFVLNPNDGTVQTTNSNINGVTDAIVANVAYTNNISGATTTELFDIDFANGRLYKQ